jgi:hypothetical protein
VKEMYFHAPDMTAGILRDDTLEEERTDSFVK